MVYKPRRERRAAGGKAAETEPLHPEHGHQYNAQGSPEEHEENAASDGFKRGGAAKKKRKEGGKVEGDKARHHLGRRARGGAAPAVPAAHHIDLHMGDHHERDGHDGPRHGDHHETPKRAAGGRVGHERPMARGGSPFSSAQKSTPPGNDKDGPGEQAPMIP